MRPASDSAEHNAWWAWGLGLLPWVWIIPSNQYFWDDWLWSQNTDFRWHLDYWLFDGAKHFVDPFIYPTLIKLGAWSFGVLTLLATAIAAWSLSKIVRGQVWASATMKEWTGPIFLVIPIFHARFSAATLEYSLALGALLIAWRVVVSSDLIGRSLVAIPLLVFAIGVPSLAVLYPLMYSHVVLSQSNFANSKHLVGAVLKNCYVLVIPGVFAIVFQIFFNTSGKYGASSGATLEFFWGLLVLLVVGSLILGLVSWYKPPHFKDSLLVVGSGVIAYFSFFPYFAVGYNPFSDFLPWRMRPSVEDGLVERVALMVSLLLLIGASVLLSAGVHRFPPLRLRMTFVLVLSVVFAAAMVVLGPMDWDSRHWFVAWPALTLFFVLIVAVVPTKLHSALLKSVFSVFLAASLVISSEYLVDSLKQKAIVAAANSDLRDFALEQANNGGQVLVVISPSPTMNKLNARLRSYRPYEWWGLLAKGMAISSSQLKLLELDDATAVDMAECLSEHRSIRISPEVSTARLRALATLRVRVELNPEPMVVCSKAAKDSWPRDSLP
jgi:hypothetical protein